MKLSLSKNEIHLWFAEQTDFELNELFDRCGSWLTENDLARYKRFYFDQHRKEFLLGRVLVRAALSEYAEDEPEDWSFIENEWGRPGLGQKHVGLDLHFNLSHSADQLVLAVSRHPFTGVDVEASTRKRRVTRIAGRYFAGAEVEELLALEERAQLRRFYELWTLKEAYIKARGMGLALSLQEFGFKFAGDDGLQFWVNPALNDRAELWQFWQIELGEKYKLALAAKPDELHAVDSISSFRRTGISSYSEVGREILRRN